MRTYESGAELAAEITKRANLFIDEFAEVPAGNWDGWNFYWGGNAMNKPVSR